MKKVSINVKIEVDNKQIVDFTQDLEADIKQQANGTWLATESKWGLTATGATENKAVEAIGEAWIEHMKNASEDSPDN